MSEAKPCLSEQQAKTIIARLQLAYGKTFTDKWQDVPQDALIADWAQRLGAYASDDEAVAYALEHLPPAFPPTAMEFAELCERGAMYRRQRERKELQREFDALVAPDGMEWCHVWEPWGTLGRTVRKLMPIGSGCRRASPPDEVAQKARDTMQRRGLKVELLTW